MNDRGFALVAVLWTLTILSGLVAIGAAGGRVGVRAAENRVNLTRTAWVTEACASEVFASLDLAARTGGRLSKQGQSQVRFERGVRCSASAASAPFDGDSSAAAIISARGWIEGQALTSNLEVFVVPAGRRAAIQWRRAW